MFGGKNKMKNKPIRVSKTILDALKIKKSKGKLRSYNAVLEKLLEKEVKI